MMNHSNPPKIRAFLKFEMHSNRLCLFCIVMRRNEQGDTAEHRGYPDQGQHSGAIIF